MEWYKKNLNILKRRYPDIFPEFEIESKDEHEIEIDAVTARDGNSALVVKKDGEIYRLNSIYHPIGEAKRWVEQFEFHNLNVITIMFGFGNGIFVKELLDNLSEDGKLILFEPETQLIKAVMQKLDITSIFEDQRLHLFLGKDSFEDVEKVITAVVTWANLATQIRCTHPQYEKLYKKEYREFWDMVAEINSYEVVRISTNSFFAKTSVENVITNLKYIKDSNYITEFRDVLPKEVPVIIVSAGPSLDKNVEVLKEAQGKALVIATDTAVKILEPKGIPYDCMATLDARKPAWYLTDYPGCKEKTMFCRLESETEIMKFHIGRKIWLQGSVYLGELYSSRKMEFPDESLGGSVATAAFAVAQILGAKNIILIGQDLAFDGEATHAGGFNDKAGVPKEKTHNNDEYMVDGVNGFQVKTRHDWFMFLRWFEDIILHNPELNVIDATEGGALIHGSKIMTLKEAIAEYGAQDFSFENIMNQIPPTFTDEKYKEMGIGLEKLKQDIDKIMQKMIQGKQCTEKFLKTGRKISPKKQEHFLKEIKKINNFLLRHDGYALVDFYADADSSAEAAQVNRLSDDVLQDRIDSVKAFKRLYQQYEDACLEIKKILEKVDG